jgi:arylsulfatase A-like enzyme
MAADGFKGYSIRTERYRYTEWDGGRQGTQLYDHQSDPHELHNLAAEPSQATIVEHMKRLLQATRLTSVP